MSYVRNMFIHSVDCDSIKSITRSALVLLWSEIWYTHSSWDAVSKETLQTGKANGFFYNSSRCCVRSVIYSLIYVLVQFFPVFLCLLAKDPTVLSLECHAGKNTVVLR